MIVVSRMLWGAAVGIALAAAAVAPSHAAIEADPHYLKALASLAGQRAAEALEEFEAIDAGELSAEDRRTLNAARQRTLVRVGQGAEALAIKDLAKGPETDFWRAQALALEGELAESTALMRSVAANAEFSNQREAVLSYAHLLVLQQQHEKAIEALGTLLGSGSAREAAESAVRIAEIRFLAGDMSGAAAGLAELSPGSDETKARAAYLRGRIALATRQWDDAEKIFGPLVKTTEALDIPLHHSVYLGMADAYAGKNESNKAARILKAFIEKYPGSPLLRFAFERLDRLGTFSRVPLDPDAVAWAQSNQAELKGIASYYLALVRARQGDGEEASHLLEEFRANYPGHFLEIDALLQLARLHLEAGRLDAVAEDLAAVRAGTDLAEVLTHLDFLEAETRFAAGDFTESLERFEALRSGGAEPLTASFNAAVAALRLNDHETLNREATFLAQQGAKGLHSELLLERGLYLAALGEPDAAAALLDFAKDHPDHPQLARVHIALAEIFFLSFPPKPVSAREHLELALEQPLSPAQAEDIDYIAVWIEHSAGDLEAAVSLGRYFLDKWPTSPHVPEIHMMLGEMYFRNREYPGAIAQFEALAKKAPLTEHAETALFFAGKAARLMMSPDSTDRAIDIWSRVVDMNGELALAAREEQALAKLGVGQEADAVTVLDTILEGDPPATGELLFSVLCSKGQALFIMAGEHGEALKEAIASFDAVLAHPEATPFWRNQAALRRAKCLERKGEPAAALEQYLDVIQGSHAVPPEYLWHYRAGFEAIRMLESQEEWEKAIEVAEHLARGGGSRSEEAAARANRLRLQHFIWKE